MIVDALRLGNDIGTPGQPGFISNDEIHAVFYDNDIAATARFFNEGRG